MNTIGTEQAFNAIPEHTYPPQFPTRVTPRNRLTHDRVAGYMLTEEQDRVDRSRVGNEEPRQYSESHDMAQSLSNSTRSDSSNFGSRVMWRLQSSDEFAPSLSDEILDFRDGGAPRMRYIGSGIAYRSDSLDRDHHIHRASRSNTWAISNFSIAKKDFANEAKNAKKLRQLGQPKKSLYEKIFGLDSKKKKSRVAVAGHRGISGSERKHWSERGQCPSYYFTDQVHQNLLTLLQMLARNTMPTSSWSVTIRSRYSTTISTSSLLLATLLLPPSWTIMAPKFPITTSITIPMKLALLYREYHMRTQLHPWISTRTSRGN